MAIEAQHKQIESSREQHTPVESHALKEVHAEQQLSRPTAGDKKETQAKLAENAQHLDVPPLTPSDAKSGAFNHSGFPGGTDKSPSADAVTEANKPGDIKKDLQSRNPAATADGKIQPADPIGNSEKPSDVKNNYEKRYPVAPEMTKPDKISSGLADSNATKPTPATVGDQKPVGPAAPSEANPTTTPSSDANQGTAWDTRKSWNLRNPYAATFSPSGSGGSDSITNQPQPKAGTGAGHHTEPSS